MQNIFEVSESRVSKNKNQKKILLETKVTCYSNAAYFESTLFLPITIELQL